MKYSKYSIYRIIFYIIYSILAVSLMSVLSEKEVIAQAVEVHNYQEGDKIPVEVIKSIISEYATGTKAYQLSHIVYCESRNYNIQSNVVSRGVREPSYGIYQIHIGYNKVTKEQALDINFATKWASDNFDSTVWYGYDRDLDICNN